MFEEGGFVHMAIVLLFGFFLAAMIYGGKK